jgi:hypothetical protein
MSCHQRTWRYLNSCRNFQTKITKNGLCVVGIAHVFLFCVGWGVSSF